MSNDEQNPAPVEPNDSTADPDLPSDPESGMQEPAENAAPSEPPENTDSKVSTPRTSEPDDGSRAAMVERIFLAASLTLGAVLLLAGLSDFGIWDPWELTAADAAQDGVGAGSSPFRQWLIREGFAALGVSGLGGRLPLALTGLLSVFAIAWLVRRFSDLRASSYVVLVACTSPLMLFNARQMLGNAPNVLVQTLVAAAALMAVYGAGDAAERSNALRRSQIWCAGLLAAVLFGVFAEGALLEVARLVGREAHVPGAPRGGHREMLLD